MPKRKMTLDPELAAEAKSIVALAFRNGPIEDVHAGKDCPNCAGKVEYSHITQDEMKNIMKRAVDTVYKLLWLKQNDPENLLSIAVTCPIVSLRRNTTSRLGGLPPSPVLNFCSKAISFASSVI